VTAEARQLASTLIDDPEYHKRLKKRLLAGELPAHLEAMFWYYAKGKPSEHVELSDMDGTTLFAYPQTAEEAEELSDDQITALLEQMLAIAKAK
jgi:hypothetical protein